MQVFNKKSLSYLQLFFIGYQVVRHNNPHVRLLRAWGLVTSEDYALLFCCERAARYFVNTQ